MTKLQEMRQAAGLSQSQLAEKAGIKIRPIQAYEQGWRNLEGASIEVLLKFCVALNCKLEDIIDSEKCLELLKKLSK